MRFLLLVAALACRIAYGAETDYFPADTKVVIGIQVRSIIDAVVRNFGADALKDSAKFTASSVLAGFDPARDLDEVLISTSGKGEKPSTLMVLRGRFDVARMATKAKPYHGVPTLEDPQHQGQIMALVDGTTALAGDAGLVRGAIDGKPAASDWAMRIEPLRGKYAVWGIGDALEGVPGDDTMKSLDQFEFGAGFEHGLDITAAAHFRKPEDAEKLSMFVKMIQAAPQTGGAKIEVETANGKMRLSVRMGEGELKKAIATQKDALAAALISRMTSNVAGPKPSSPPPPKDGKIVTNSQGETMTVTLPGKK